ncbi:MAG: CehA/McbA family metallohydrolase, partial [bacterium]|nr:CehA/McbA family metallohydrolase [bacterium]
MKRLARLLSLAVVLVALVVGLRERTSSMRAADGEEITWGATDPTWSPDSRQLAFSLFGSIWQVAADGGAAKQITDGAGYHAHPAWSPKGDRIAFVSGPEPRGRIPNISGSLAVVDLASGEVRQLKTPHPVASTLAWSPDGKKILCGLRAPNSGSLLHEIDAGGGVRRLQQRPQRGAAGSWIDVDWSGATGEIFFAAQRYGAPQVWSMPSGDPPISIQLPLTGYQRKDIVFPHSLSATPDGQAVIYSAVVVNGKGDYELYRVPRNGGEPEAVTNTVRDEFAPAVSPDGRWIAHVSNHLGNIDLFLMPTTGGDKKHVRITGLEFRKPSGKVRLKVLDELGQPTRVRLYVRAADGKAYSPAGSPVFYYPLDPGPKREGFFIADGDDTFPVPAGRLRLVALKGVEYRILERTVEISAGDTTEITLNMERWTNWNQRGWYTGENHFHANYNGSYYQRPPQSLGWLEAEDLNAANMIVANAAGAFVHDKEFFTGAVHPLSTARYFLYWGQEYRNSDPLGHMAFANIKSQVPPSYTSVIGSDSPYDFPLNTMAALAAKNQGGMVSYVHPIGGQTRDVFDTNLGAKEIPIGAALDAVDSIDILPAGEAAYQMWYRLLNCGFRISPGAGTDTFTNWRGINRIPGGSRQYVEVGSRMSWEAWIERFREGRAFATNAPLLSLTVNGQGMGGEVRFRKGAPYEVRLAAEVTSRVPLRQVEFIQNGKVIESREVDANARAVHVDKTVTVDESAWFAVRVTGRPSRGVGSGGVPRAHSGAVYVLADGEPVLVREDLEL